MEFSVSDLVYLLDYWKKIKTDAEDILDPIRLHIDRFPLNEQVTEIMNRMATRALEEANRMIPMLTAEIEQRSKDYFLKQIKDGK